MDPLSNTGQPLLETQWHMCLIHQLAISCLIHPTTQHTSKSTNYDNESHVYIIYIFKLKQVMWL